MIKWFDVKAVDGIGEIFIYGEITDFKFFEEDVTPGEIKDKLDELKNVQEVKLYVNSPGGGVFAGVAIYNALKRFDKPVTAYVDGLAASIASLIVLAADKVVMPFNSLLMIHNPWGCICGDSKSLRDMADSLDKIKGLIIDTYQTKTSLQEEELSKMMDKETWLSGPEALELGFADEVEEEKKVAACYVGDNIKFNDVEVQINKFRAFPKSKFKEHRDKQPNLLKQRHRHKINMLSANFYKEVIA